MSKFAVVVGFFLAVAAAGCGDDNMGSGGSAGSGSGGAGGSPSTMPDASMPDAADHGAPSTTYPAFPPDMATIPSNGGPVLDSMVIVTITYSSDTNGPTFEAFGDKIGATQYWHAINSEYGVGPATSGTADHVHITTAAPMTMTDMDVQTLIQQNAGMGSWPAATAQTLYTLYVPSTTSLDLGGDACMQGIGGYHDQLTVGSMQVPYAVVLECGSQSNALSAASHEFNEAATDPLPETRPAFVGFDNDHLAWEFFNALQDELGDACEIFRSAFYQDNEPDFTYSVQRQWSNASAVAGHNPCVPVPQGAFFNVTTFPSDKTDIAVDLTSIGYHRLVTKGYKGVVGQPLTFPVGFFSDADTGGPWTLSSRIDAQLSFPDQQGNPINNGTAMISIDKTSGTNGEKAYVTVTPMTFSPLGVIYFELTSTGSDGRTKHYLPILIGQ